MYCFGSGFPKSRNIWENDIRPNIEEELRRQGHVGDIEWEAEK
jgi:hypothetical protein